MGSRHNGPTIGSLLKSLCDNLLFLVRQEIMLARRELAENISQAGRHLTVMALGGAIALAGAIVLLLGCANGAAVGLEATGMDPEVAVWLGPLLLGAVVFAIGLGLVQGARHRLRSSSLVPTRTVQTLKEDSTWAKEKLHRP
jgi:hypothetical protein